MFEAVIFDWDGTLADTKKAILYSFHRALQEINCDVPDEVISSRIGIGASETFKAILKEAGCPFDFGVVEGLVARKSQLEVEYAGHVKLFDGARALLEGLDGKVKVGLASMNNRNVIEHQITTLKVEKYFQTVLTAESITRSKPDPEIFLKSAAALDVNPEDCVVLEDSVFGVKAAKSAGMACVAVTTGQYGADALLGESADLVVSSLCSIKVAEFILGR
ncbi:MAG: HAD family phosphatase [Candidatus Bathyarchaeota archaeon]|nr:HAD family phosphatase [Candidatus Bathyarchaeota archaeon]